VDMIEDGTDVKLELRAPQPAVDLDPNAAVVSARVKHMDSSPKANTYTDKTVSSSACLFSIEAATRAAENDGFRAPPQAESAPSKAAKKPRISE
jgi:hypothetical protein